MWLALRFPHWALDSRPDASGERNAGIWVIDTGQTRHTVVAADDHALRAGVRRGMAVADARIRNPAGALLERRPRGEQAALERLAGWAWRYSNQVHFFQAADDIECTRLVLELGGSERLFGGRKPLLRRVRRDLEAFGYRHRAGLGVSPQAALAFARARRKHRGLGLEQLPLSCLALDRHSHDSLIASGLRLTGELLALPPATLARRYGHSMLEEMERLRARRPHGLSLYALPEFYRTRHELTGTVETVQGLAFVLRRILAELAAFLRGADAVIQALEIRLMHERASPTRLTLQPSTPTRDADHLERIVRDRLTRTTLAAPVHEIALASDRLRPFEPAQNGMWHDACSPNQAGKNWPAVLDRLRARLGHEAVRWLHAPADHRPEYATACRNHPPSSVDSDGPPRPVWLLDTPQPFAGALELIAGPERIESGWWENSIRRDYFRARDDQGRLLWVYRDLTRAERNGKSVYYLHGLFG